MNNTYSLDQIQKTGYLNADLIMRQYKLNRMAKSKEIKLINPRIKQFQIAKLLESSCSTRQRNRKKINMLSPYRILPPSKPNQRKQETPNTKLDDDKVTSIHRKKTSNDVKMTSNEPVRNKKKQIERWCKY